MGCRFDSRLFYHNDSRQVIYGYLPLWLGSVTSVHRIPRSLVRFPSGALLGNNPGQVAQTHVPLSLSSSLCTRYCTANVGKREHSASLYHSRHCGIILKLRLDGLDYTAVCFTTHDCRWKLKKVPVQAKCGLKVGTSFTAGNVTAVHRKVFGLLAYRSLSCVVFAFTAGVTK